MQTEHFPNFVKDSFLNLVFLYQCIWWPYVDKQKTEESCFVLFERKVSLRIKYENSDLNCWYFPQETKLFIDDEQIILRCVFLLCSSRKTSEYWFQQLEADHHYRCVSFSVLKLISPYRTCTSLCLDLFQIFSSWEKSKVSYTLNFCL
jgi:hypothetical protein